MGTVQHPFLKPAHSTKALRRRSKQLHKQRRLADRSQAEIDQNDGTGGNLSGERTHGHILVAGEA
jgi:hypothetical protein